MDAMKKNLQGAPVLVVGAGIMGAGIAQTAAQAGHPVLLFDLREGAAATARGKLGSTFDSLVAKGRLEADAAQAALQRIQVVSNLDAAASAGLVVEAIVEQLDAKRALVQRNSKTLAAGRRGAGHQHLVDQRHGHRQRPAAPGPASSACTSSTRCR